MSVDRQNSSSFFVKTLTLGKIHCLMSIFFDYGRQKTKLVGCTIPGFVNKECKHSSEKTAGKFFSENFEIDIDCCGLS